MACVPFSLTQLQAWHSVALTNLMEVTMRALNAKIDSNHETVINSLNIDKRLEALERDRQVQAASAVS